MALREQIDISVLPLQISVPGKTIQVNLEDLGGALREAAELLSKGSKNNCPFPLGWATQEWCNNNCCRDAEVGCWIFYLVEKAAEKRKEEAHDGENT